jgi:peptide/nickel transport system permease protein
MKELIKNRAAFAGLIYIAVMLIFAIFAPLIAPYDPGAIDAHSVLMAPSRAHILGTDTLGRDIFSRIVYGSRISLAIGFVAVGIAVQIGRAHV